MSAADPSQRSLPERLDLIVAELRRKLAFHAAKDRALAPLVLILWNRLSRIVARFAAVSARHRAGTLRSPPKPNLRLTPPPPPCPPPQRPPPPRDKLPRQRGWLLRRVPQCGVYGEHLRLLLEEPDMAALIEAAPQLRRVLRPLWRMLRREAPPPVLRNPAPPRPPRPPRRKAPRRRPKRPRPAAESRSSGRALPGLPGLDPRYLKKRP